MGYFGTKEFKLKNGKVIVVRDAAVSDAKKLISHIEIMTVDGLGQVLEPGEFIPTTQDEVDWVESTRANHSEIILGACYAEELVGLIKFSQEKRVRLQHTGYFGMGVVPGWRSCGIGYLLLSQMLEWLECYSNIEIVHLAVLANNPNAIGLYQKLGFELEGRRANYIKYRDNTYVDELLMAKVLRSEKYR
jgi:RimJ/RimL family protein N-acetyltransferase